MPVRKPSLTRYPWAHHYDTLITGWRKIHRRAGLRMVQYGVASGYPLYYLESRNPRENAHHVFLSAGIHGDEPAPPIALLEWIVRNPQISQALNLLLFPCLNPWGLVNNVRMDEKGRDLNRSYQNDRIPQTAAHRKILKGRRFCAALSLHEDYDAQGVYIYEVPRKKDFWAEKLLLAASRHVPLEGRGKVEGRKAVAGVIRRNVSLSVMPKRPEALHLFHYHTDRAFTLETPSEYFIDARVEATIAALHVFANLCIKTENYD